MFEWIKNEKKDFSILLVLVIGFWTYFFQYYTPPSQFWDENYHIASAQKYIDGVFFFEPHPPLGKMLIAAGEEMLRPNEDLNTSSFDTTDYIRHFPAHYSFAGMRFVPALAGWINAVLIFLILYTLFARLVVAWFGTWLYLFDNALIVHSRAAMLESIQLFFILLAIWLFARGWQREKPTIRDYLGIGVVTGLALMVKANSAILLLLLFFYWYREWCIVGGRKFWRIITGTMAYMVAVVAVVYAVFSLHFALTSKVIGKNTYFASPTVLEAVRKGTILEPENTLKAIQDYFSYMKRYEKGVPRYNPCKKGENGSLAITWPLMDKTINYRWSKEKTGDVRYLYLVGNPIVWLLVLLAVFFGTVQVSAYLFYRLSIDKPSLFAWVVMFTGIYLSYMVAVLQIDRVMYLYHYFIPLVIGMLLAATHLESFYGEFFKNRDKWVYGAVGMLMLLVFVVYLFFMPLTYYIPIGLEEFNKRIWFDFWHMQPIL